jgi:hypothetical protein
MGTEEYWQKQKKIEESNKQNINPILAQTYEDMKELILPKGAKYQYIECLKGALYLRQWAMSDSLNIDDMSMLICRDTGCELQYCQQTLSDPFEQPFKNCDAQYRNLTRCIIQEQDRYLTNPEGRTMQEQVLYMLEKKKKEKYFNILQEKPLTEDREPVMQKNIEMKHDV